MDKVREIRLVGWKRIAKQLSCSERTARRWEREEALPVHRQKHAARSTVYAHAAELEAWLDSRAETKPVERHSAKKRSFPLWVFAAAAVMISLTGIAFLKAGNSFAPTTASASQDPVAVDLYERGRSLWLERGKEPNIRAIKLLEKAVKRDENYAVAWEALGSAWLTLPTYSSDANAQNAFNEALFASNRAIELDPSLTEARSVMASLAQLRGDWLAAQKIFEAAHQQDPRNPMIILWLAEHYRDLGYLKQYRAQLRAANELAPNSPPILMALAMGEQIEADPRGGLEQLLYLWEDVGLQTPTIWFGIWHIYVRLEDYDAADRWIDASPAPMQPELLHSFLDAKRLNNPDASQQLSSNILIAYKSGFPGWFAYTLLDHLGAHEVALDIAENEAKTGHFELSIVLFDPMFPAGRQTEKFERVVKELGFVEHWKERGPPDFCDATPKAPVCMNLRAAMQ
ncbi:MAG: tetratricopeptide repeat protein [Erythrobacter sp.]|nr:tetratricopeptide repeat protein [Erythrobacter sp.]